MKNKIKYIALIIGLALIIPFTISNKSKAQEKFIIGGSIEVDQYLTHQVCNSILENVAIQNNNYVIYDDYELPIGDGDGLTIWSLTLSFIYDFPFSNSYFEIYIEFDNTYILPNLTIHNSDVTELYVQNDNSIYIDDVSSIPRFDNMEIHIAQLVLFSDGMGNNEITIYDVDNITSIFDDFYYGYYEITTQDLFTLNQYNQNYNNGKNEVINNSNDYDLYTEEQYDQNYQNGYNAGLEVNDVDAAYNQGYNEGIAYQKAISGDSGKNFFTTIFSGLGDFFSIELFPGISFGLIIGVPFVISIAWVVIRLFRGGGN